VVLLFEAIHPPRGRRGDHKQPEVPTSSASPTSVARRESVIELLLLGISTSSASRGPGMRGEERNTTPKTARA
jgi:hypothetical protein